MKRKYRNWLIFLYTLLPLVVLSVILSLSVGEMKISPFKVISILMHGEGMEYTILHEIRLPRIILGFAVGGALSLAGVILQGVYRNPLVEPYTLGISGGAALGVSIVIGSGLYHMVGSLVLPAAGFIGGLITIFLVFFLSMRKGSLHVQSMLLIGVMISFVASSAMMFVMATTTAESLHNIMFWIMGSLDEPEQVLIKITFWISVSGLLISYMFVRPLNALRLGESRAKHLGVNTTRSVRILFILASLLTGVCVSVAGLIGFVGLVVPHFIKLLIGNDYRVLLAGSFLGGGIFVLFCDAIARTIILPNELPIGVITGIFGGVLFLLVITGSLQRKKSTE